jgi:hypothetical protein
VKYDTPGALRMALERRLLETSKQTGIPLTRLRKAVVFERMSVGAEGRRGARVPAENSNPHH